jgi:bud site selection protein 20
MGQPQGRKSRKHKNGNHPLHRTRNYGRDVDQIHGDLSEKQKTLLKNTVVDEDKPGLGIWYCIECARWFIDENTLTKHKSTKVHKRRFVFLLNTRHRLMIRLKRLDQGIYTQKDAEAAIGLSTDNTGLVLDRMDVR